MSKNIFKTICEEYKKNLKEKTNAKGNIIYEISEEYKEDTIKKINSWFEPIKEKYTDLTVKLKTGQSGSSRKESPWIQMYIGKENSSGTRGVYCGLSFEDNNLDMSTWIGVGVGSHQNIVSVKEKEHRTENAINDLKRVNGDELKKGFNYKEINSDGIVVKKTYHIKDLDMDEVKNDLIYLIAVYKEFLLKGLSENDENVENLMGRNIIYKGYPGTGKSNIVEETYLKRGDSFIDRNRYERITFYPEYSNAEFIGTIRPTIDDKGNPIYEPFAGPFTKILKKALEDKNNNYYLIIEEINRGDAESIFGDVFQLLDRKNGNGESVYTITNPIISMCLTDKKSEDEEIFIPRNLSIIATMNISDENVVTLDTAFERRWETEWISGMNGKWDNLFIKGMGDITWGNFRKIINESIINQDGVTRNEDKQLGPYFINETFVSEKNNENEQDRKKFLNKVILYLYTKVCKYDNTSIFTNEIKSIDLLVKKFLEKEYLGVFKESIKNQLLERKNKIE